MTNTDGGKNRAEIEAKLNAMEDDALDGIQFADEVASTPTKEAEAAAAEKESAPQQFTSPGEALKFMREQALERRKDELSNPQQAMEQRYPEAKVVEVDPSTLPQPKTYRVVETAMVARGGSKFALPAGKIISANHYNIADLQQAGVKLEEQKRA